MDYRDRRYFLVSFHHDTRSLRIGNMRRADPSIKFHPPYNHFHGDIQFNGYDGARNDITGLRFPSAMLSCKKDKADAILYELRKIAGEGRWCGYYELTQFDNCR